MNKQAYTYILANKKNGTLYVGVTNNLERRMSEHRQHLVEGFTKKYDITKLVWYEYGNNITDAIKLEKKIKNRGRQWKISLIEKKNPQWNDLSAECSGMDSATIAQNDKGSNAE